MSISELFVVYGNRKGSNGGGGVGSREDFFFHSLEESQTMETNIFDSDFYNAAGNYQNSSLEFSAVCFLLLFFFFVTFICSYIVCCSS